jgi:hypothetical protein
MVYLQHINTIKSVKDPIDERKRRCRLKSQSIRIILNVLKIFVKSAYVNTVGLNKMQINMYNPLYYLQLTIELIIFYLY